MRNLQTRLCLGTDEGPTDLPVSGDWRGTYRPACVWGLMRDLQTRLCMGTDEGPTDPSVSGDWWGTYRPACVWGLMRDLQTRLCLGTDEGPTDPPVYGDWWGTYRPACVWGLMRDLQTRLCMGTDEGPTDPSVSGVWWGTYRPACVWGLMRDLQTRLGDWTVDTRPETTEGAWTRGWRRNTATVIDTDVTQVNTKRHTWCHVSHTLSHVTRSRHCTDHHDVIGQQLTTLLGGGGVVEWHHWELKHSLLNLIHCLIMLLLLVALAITSWPRQDWPHLGHESTWARSTNDILTARMTL